MEEKEPTILDYVKAKFMPWKGIKINFPPLEGLEKTHSHYIGNEFPVEEKVESVQPNELFEFQQLAGARESGGKKGFPWRSIVALVFALFAQMSISPPERDITQSVIFFLLSASALIWGWQCSEWSLAELPQVKKRVGSFAIRSRYLWIGVFILAIAFLAFRGNLFTFVNLGLWTIALLSLLIAFWLPEQRWQFGLGRLKTLMLQEKWSLFVSRWTLLLFITCVAILFFRFYRLDTVPPEMTSDHAEKLLDVADVMAGEYHIFFPRNAGREALQMYLDALIASGLGTGLTYITLKIGTAIVGLLTLPFIYLLGKEIGNRYIGLWAMVFAGLSYWHNVISRVGLRFPFYPFFTAILMYFLIRGMRDSNRNDWILAGLALGLSFYGYTADRILPFLCILGVGLFLLHKDSKGVRHQTLWHFCVLALIAFAVFIPLFRYMIEYPEAFAYRSLTRMGTLERPYPGPVLEIFLGNLWKAWIMFFWEGGNVWLASIPYYPALGTVSGALYFLGSILVFIRYIKQRNWLDLFLLLSIPTLMLPSILSLAFPIENPNLYRTGGALVPVFLIVGLGMDGLLRAIKSSISHPWGERIAWTIGILLLVWSAFQDFDWVFHRYYQQYRDSAWNTSEVGQVIQSFASSVGSGDSAWVVPYPHWVDTRLVGINAGYPLKDYALWPDHLEETLEVPPPKLFIVKPDDQVAIQKLHSLYPKGWFQLYISKVPTKDFLIFFVPPETETNQ